MPRGKTKDAESEYCEDEKYMRKKWHPHNTTFGGVYFLAFIGAAIYYIQQSETFWTGVLGFLKAIIWPTMLIYKIFTIIKM